MKSGFTLVEVVVATVVILVVLTALSVALTLFVRGGRSLELRDGALTLARAEIAEMERTGKLPLTGETVRSDTLWSRPYTIHTVVNERDGDALDVEVAVSSGDTISVELVRRFYIRRGNSRQEYL